MDDWRYPNCKTTIGLCHSTFVPPWRLRLSCRTGLVRGTQPDACARVGVPLRTKHEVRVESFPGVGFGMLALLHVPVLARLSLPTLAARARSPSPLLRPSLHRSKAALNGSRLS
jgi:hypothetical protein